MTSSLQVEKNAKTQDVKEEEVLNFSEDLDLSTLEPGVDVERRQGGLLIRGKDQDLGCCIRGILENQDGAREIQQNSEGDGAKTLDEGRVVAEVDEKPLKTAQQDSKLISGKVGRYWDCSEEEEGNEGDQISQKTEKLNSGKLVGENSEPTSGKVGRDGDLSDSEEGRKGDQISQKTEKLAKDSVFEASRPPALILPEGDHGYRGGMPPYVAERREEKARGNRGLY